MCALSWAHLRWDQCALIKGAQPWFAERPVREGLLTETTYLP